MSSRKMKAARKRVEPIAAQTKAEQWAAFRFPIWMRIVGIFVPSVKTKYQHNFERRLSNAIHVTTKAVTHKVARRPA
jgi:hypothetical protein